MASTHVTSGLSVLAKSTRLHKVSFRYGIPIDPSFRSWEDNHRTPRGIIHTISVKGGTDKLSETKSNTVSAIVVLKTMQPSSLVVFRLLPLTAPSLLCRFERQGRLPVEKRVYRSKQQNAFFFISVVVALTMRLLLLLAEQSEQRGLGHADHLETDSRNITHGMTGTTETGNQHLVVLIHVVQATITRHEGSDLLAVLDELHTDALTNSRVGLLGLHTPSD